MLSERRTGATLGVAGVKPQPRSDADDQEARPRPRADRTHRQDRFTNEAEKAEKAMDAAAAEPEPVAIKSKPELDDGIDGELVGVTP